MKTKRYFLFGLILVLLTIYSCATAPPSDPYSLEAQAENALRLAHAQQTATAQVALSEANREILNQAQTQASLDNAITATEYAFQFEQTKSAATILASATAQAIVMQGTGTAVAEIQATETREAHQTETALIEFRIASTHAAASTQTSIAIEREQGRLAREKVTRATLWGLVVVGFGLTLYLVAISVKTVVQTYSRQKRWVEGAGTLIFETPGGAIVIDPRKMFAPSIVLNEPSQAVTMPVLIDHPLQQATTQAAQVIELAKVMFSGPSGSNHSGRKLSESVDPAKIPTPSSEIELPPMAPWHLLDDWQGNGLPLGLETSGLLLADPEFSPHLLMAGTSGSGKTRFGLRPLIAGALAAGWQTLIFDRSGLDFLPFELHANAYIITLADAGDAAGYLEMIYGEILRRFQILRKAEQSTWGHLAQPPGPRLLTVFDEFANLADSLENKEREKLWRGARMIAAEGRKAGVHLALALQDPTHKSLDLRIRRNCTPVAFRVRDDDASRVVLGAGGAEALPPRQFIAVVNARLHRAVAFAPSDEELKDFLLRRQGTALPAPEWLDHPAPYGHSRAELNQLVVETHQRTKSLSATQREVFRTSGGADFYRIKEILGDAGIEI